MKITRHYKNIVLELDRDDFMSSVGQTMHETIKAAPKHLRTWNFANFSWTIDKSLLQLVIDIKNSVISFSQEEIDLANEEFNNNWIEKGGYTI